MKSFCLVLFALTLIAGVATQQTPWQSQSAVAAPFRQLTPQRNATEIGLTLVVRPRDRYRPGDVNVSVRFVNYGNRTVMLPKPTAGCQSADGYIEISRELLTPAKYPERGSVCVADFFGKRDLPAETDRWVTLAPGAAYEVHAELAFDNPGARYKIRAKYVPAMLTAEELRLLNEHGISAVQESPESKPLVLRSPNPK